MWSMEILLLAKLAKPIDFNGLELDILEGSKNSASSRCVYLCACVCTFCSSVTYCATMKDDSVVKLSAVAAMCEYILSTSLEHSRYTWLSGPLKTTIIVNSIICWRFCIVLRSTLTYREALGEAVPPSLMLLKGCQGDVPRQCTNNHFRSRNLPISTSLNAASNKLKWTAN